LITGIAAADGWQTRVLDEISGEGCYYYDSGWLEASTWLANVFAPLGL
jgi:hypothetical protein